MPFRAARLIRLAGLCLLAAPAAAAAATIDASYGVSLIGLPVGKATLKLVTDGTTYQIQGEGGVRGVSRLLSDATGGVSAAGTLPPGPRPLPVGYRQVIRSDKETENVSIDFANDAVAKTVIDPDRPKHRRNRVPLTEADMRGVLDPASALVIPTGGATGSEICNRTVPVFDGRQRFDIVLSYQRTETVEGGSHRYSGPAQVCAMRYVPIAGHRKNRRTIKELAENRDLEIWLAPLASVPVAVPVRLRVGTNFGPLVFRLERFRADP
ncbi:DUF3108 domain-containing protein [Propylenella binzhouense]|uniref:DUF3108 domain-containing protein n=1 Tax=Propylenella binzhouense TaxID=2555902 RepID=A0A964T7X5_9HYPH|nr:DUF3108 domain-containing protein [Propylenella binzhouense]MYZ50115.1 DUF3108 domain-containing protein [Propylenella binzhouense]